MIDYEFAILRYRHNIASGEFVNIGIVMWLPSKAQLLCKIDKHWGRVSEFFQPFDSTGYRRMIQHLQTRFTGTARQIEKTRKSNDNYLLNQSIEHCLSKLVGEDESCFQWSKPMYGGVEDPALRFEQLLDEFIFRHEMKTGRDRHDEMRIWTNVETLLSAQGLTEDLTKNVPIRGKNYRFRFKAGWHNGVPQVLEPISFDYEKPQQIVEKANTWVGRLMSLQSDSKFQMTGVVAPPSDSIFDKNYAQALSILKSGPSIRKLITEDQLAAFATEIRTDLQHTKGNGKKPNTP